MIPYVREVAYLSPSSLRQLEESPAEFYLRRLGPPEFAPPNPEQGFPAAVGSAFDSCIKATIAGIMAIPHNLEIALTNVEHERERAIPMGYELAVKYAATGALRARGVAGFTALEQELEGEFEGVPVKGHLDAVWDGRVLDWKVTGAGWPGSRSPRQGYVRILDTEAPHVAVGPHDKCGVSLEEIDEAWATQLAIYSWLLKGPRIRKQRVAIDELVVGKNGRLRVAQFDADISVAYQRAVRARLRAAWSAIQEQRVVDPTTDLETLRAIR